METREVLGWVAFGAVDTTDDFSVFKWLISVFGSRIPAASIVNLIFSSAIPPIIRITWSSELVDQREFFESIFVQ
jgi:hypothetical protein